MAKSNCKYHPQRAARWNCRKCLTHFCSGCVSRDGAGDQPFCPMCRVPLAEIGTEHLVPAFWSRLPAFFAFPLHPKALFPLIAMVLLSALVGYSSLPGFGIQLALFLLFYKLAYSSLARLADGYRDPPNPLHVVAGSLGPATKQFAVLFILAIPFAPIGMFLGPTGTILYALAFTGLLPASVMVLAVTESVGSAVNPGLLFGMVRTIGVPYLALLGLLTLINGGPSVFQEFLTGFVGSEFFALAEQAEIDPDSIDEEALATAQAAFLESYFGWVVPVIIFVQGYFTLIAFALMGYVMYQYHGKLGLPVAVDVETGKESKEGSGNRRTGDHPLLGDIEVLTREGRLEDAARLLRDRVIANRDDLVLHERFHRLLMALGDSTRVCGHGAEYIGLLLRASSAARAAEVYRDCRKANPSFRLDTPDQALPLAKVMFQTRDYAGVVALANGFHRDAPAHRDIPELYLLTARALSEGMNQEAKALPILKSLLKRFPGHPITPQVKGYLQAMERLAAPTV